MTDLPAETGQRPPRLGATSRDLTDLWMAVGVLSGAVFYRPITFWAANAWDLSAPQDVLATGLLELFIAICLLMLTTRVTAIPPLPVALLVGACLFIVLNWARLALLPPAFWLFTSILLIPILSKYTGETAMQGVAIVTIVISLVTPVVQLVIAHIEQRASYPLLQTDSSGMGEPTGKIEDVLVLIVDSYPMLRVAQDRFGHDTSLLKEGLTDLGFDVPPVSWSHNTFTGLAIPSMMQLTQVIDESPKLSWGNRKDRYDIARGDSFVVSAFRTAGFRYTHIESGWNGGVCGNADECKRAPWFSGAQSLLLAPSLIGSPLTTTLGHPIAVSSIRSFEHLNDLHVFNDANSDFVFAHSLLPHPPYVTNGDCGIVDEVQGDRNVSPHIDEQLSCVDSLILEAISALPRETAVLVASDHGSATAGQLEKPVADWTDSDVAERLGAFLAYRIPSDCPPAEVATSVAAMRSIVDCALHTDMPRFNSDLVIGEVSPQRVDSIRLKLIEDKLDSESGLTG